MWWRKAKTPAKKTETPKKYEEETAEYEIVQLLKQDGSRDGKPFIRKYNEANAWKRSNCVLTVHFNNPEISKRYVLSDLLTALLDASDLDVKLEPSKPAVAVQVTFTKKQRRS